MPPYVVLERVEASVAQFRARIEALVPGWLPNRATVIAEQVEAYRVEVMRLGAACYQDGVTGAQRVMKGEA